MTQEMNQYIGTKRVLARPMNRQAYNDYRGWTLPENENGADEGMLVEYLDGGQANDPRHKGYIYWWSPLDVFNRAYRQTTGMTFGEAIEALKAGLSVARAGWNGKGMWLLLIQGSNDIAKLHGYGFGEMLNEPTFRDAIFMKTVDNQLVPWTASQTDVLAEDWAIADSAVQAQPTRIDYEAEVDKMLAQINVAYTSDEFNAFLTAMMKGIVTAGSYAENKEAAQGLAVLLSNKVRESIPKAFEWSHG